MQSKGYVVPVKYRATILERILAIYRADASSNEAWAIRNFDLILKTTPPKLVEQGKLFLGPHDWLA